MTEAFKTPRQTQGRATAMKGRPHNARRGQTAESSLSVQVESSRGRRPEIANTSNPFLQSRHVSLGPVFAKETNIVWTTAQSEMHSTASKDKPLVPEQHRACRVCLSVLSEVDQTLPRHSPPPGHRRHVYFMWLGATPPHRASRRAVTPSLSSPVRPRLRYGWITGNAAARG